MRKAKSEITVKLLSPKLAKPTTQRSKARWSYFTSKRVFWRRARSMRDFFEKTRGEVGRRFTASRGAGFSEVFGNARACENVSGTDSHSEFLAIVKCGSDPAANNFQRLKCSGRSINKTTSYPRNSKMSIVPIKHALISVSDKLGLVDFARALAAAASNCSLPAARASTWNKPGLTVREISAYTGFPEMMDGRHENAAPQGARRHFVPGTIAPTIWLRCASTASCRLSWWS